MSKGVPALKDHQKLDKSYGWGPSFPPQNPGLKPGAWGLKPGGLLKNHLKHMGEA